MRGTTWRVFLLCGVVAVAMIGCEAAGIHDPTGLTGDVREVASNIPTDVTLTGIPATEAEFDAQWASLRGSPEGAAAGLILAALMMEKNADLGQRCMMKTVAESYLAGGGPTSSLRLAFSQFGGSPAIARSYVGGTTPPAYALPAPPIEISFYSDAAGVDVGANRRKLFVATSGADSRRPVTVEDVGGTWRVYEASTLWVGVKK